MIYSNVLPIGRVYRLSLKKNGGQVRRARTKYYEIFDVFSTF